MQRIYIFFQIYIIIKNEQRVTRKLFMDRYMLVCINISAKCRKRIMGKISILYKYIINK